MKKILLLSMPFGALERPALGLSLLKTRLQEVGIGCDVRYLSFTFADLIGAEDYLWISSALPYIAFAGDWSFSEALYGARAEADAGYIEKVLRKTWRIDDESIARIKRIRALTSPFLNYCLESIPWEEYAVAGFTSTFEQNLASLALAKRIKAAHPAVILVFGGANWEAEMGQNYTAGLSSWTMCVPARRTRVFQRSPACCLGRRAPGPAICQPESCIAETESQSQPARVFRFDTWTRCPCPTSAIISSSGRKAAPRWS